MSQTNEELAEQFKDMLMGQDDYATAFDGGAYEGMPKENPLETDFFKALNAFRAARSQGDPSDVAAAEERLRAVVRSELTGEACEPDA